MTQLMQSNGLTIKAADMRFSRRSFYASSRAALAVAACLSSGAQDTGPARAGEAESGAPALNADSGAVIAAQGTARIPACAGCHALDGTSDGTGAFPRIAGLPANYMEAQLHDFATGVRENAIMSPIAKALTAGEIGSTAAYYANAKAPCMPLKSGDPALTKLGESLATAGDAAKGIPGCDACHGPQGNGQTGIAPYLGGQYAHYIAFTLHMWQRGYRKNSSAVMEPIAKELDDQKIAAAAAYYQEVCTPSAATAKK